MNEEQGRPQHTIKFVQIWTGEKWSSLKAYPGRSREFIPAEHNKSTKYAGLYTITHVNTGYCAANNLFLRQAEILSVIFEKLIGKCETLEEVKVAFDRLPLPIRQWITEWR